MQTEEDIIGDSCIDENGNTVEPGYIPRPTDQRVNFSLFFQDYIPGNLNYKIRNSFVFYFNKSGLSRFVLSNDFFSLHASIFF